MAKQIEWNVDGMTCTGCTGKVSKYLRDLGLNDVYVDLISGTVRFGGFDSDQQLDRIKKGLAAMGYQVKTEDYKPWWTLEKKLIISAVFTVPLILLHFVGMHDMRAYTLALLLAIVPITIGLWHYGKSTFRSLKHRSVDMDILIFIGGLSATIYSVIGYILRVPDYNFFETAASIFTIVFFGYWVEHLALRKTQDFIAQLRDNFPKNVRRVTADKLQQIPIEKAGIGDVLRLEQADIVPLDGKIISGEVLVSEAMLTGESEAISKSKGMELYSGSEILSGRAEFIVHSLPAQSTMNQILDLVKKAEAQKPSLHKLADKVSSVFVPTVLTLSALTFLVSFYFFGIDFQHSAMRSIAVLVISCPCALGLATPAAVAVGINGALKKGILIKRADIMEHLSRADYFLLDKTGTLTQATVSLETMENAEYTKAVIFKMVQKSSHPIAKAVRKILAQEQLPFVKMEEIIERKGQGVEAKDNSGGLWRFGAVPWAGNAPAKYRSILTKDGKLYAGVISDEYIPKDVGPTIRRLKEKAEVVLLSGDKKNKVQEIAQTLDIDVALGELNPEEKLNHVKEYTKKGVTVMVGDGINDSAALSAAHVGVSLNEASKLVANAADVILTAQRFGKLHSLSAISSSTLKNIKQNIFWAFAYNLIAIPLAMTGQINPMWAAFFMSFSDIVIIGNAIRYKKVYDSY